MLTCWWSKATEICRFTKIKKISYFRQTVSDSFFEEDICSVTPYSFSLIFEFEFEEPSKKEIPTLDADKLSGLHGEVCANNWQWIYAFESIGETYGPMRWSPAKPAKMFIANCSWWSELSTVWNFLCQNVALYATQNSVSCKACLASVCGKRTLLVQLCSYRRGNKSGKESHSNPSPAPFGGDRVERFLLKNFQRGSMAGTHIMGKKLRLIVDDDTSTR